MSLTRRALFKTTIAGIAGLSLTTSKALHAQSIVQTTTRKKVSVVDKSVLPKGHFVVMGYEHTHLSKEYTGFLPRSALIGIEYPSRAISIASSASSNLHDLVAPLENPENVIFGIGHDVRQVLEIFNQDLSLRTKLSLDGWRLKGHGIPYEKGILISAEYIDRPNERGYLLYMNAAGTILSRHPTGALSPHEIIDCGDYLAVAHYGNETRKEAFTAGHFYELIEPGVSFIDKSTLKLVRFHHVEQSQGAITHIAKQGNGQVIAMGLQFTKPVFDGEVAQAVMQQAKVDGVNLIAEETGPNAIYQIPLPLYFIDVEQGVTGVAEAPPSLMRRGQSFCQDLDLGLTVATFSASQTIMVQDANTRAVRYLNTLDYGVADPRGCAMIPNTGCVAVSGNSNNIAIINLFEDKLVDLIGVSLERHSHLRWFEERQ